MPPELDQLTEITGRLGKLHELALVFTWIAGLLNILAIWDCVQGPAYGIGDEQWSPMASGDHGFGSRSAPEPKTPTSSKV